MHSYLILTLLSLLIATASAHSINGTSSPFLNGTASTFPNGTASLGNASATSSTPLPMSSTSWIDSNAAANQWPISGLGLLVAVGVALVRI
ncbi:hypothetical protein LTR91_003183 [Friedmanniomyces endolithicus]|uniref:Uncharacterized protein n=1 Tax=Friedmanniomyces endolithicus TaxID=329885 RepID=A0AAN6R034_9PEZI|nr:hypothetical protein LTR94_002710 [Friedmanniomyces endolithicus]KAK0794576.1 hypothetical protein LTR59_007761 [Friedmanniomyces endolithicus]KAK0797906.1 hypothetical protein LTR75_009723 [Friedmanniomyces endolithicus]KAK0800640.1 hypothetical protein LTR38_007074 [Friedmanniomyces endolithicus]KAK0849071.1 hypothetical protein LTR03_005396 [Friedmanniomyces endolithicus]